MIKKMFIAMYLISFANYAFSGTTLVGTRFLINNEDKALNIKIMNDDESDYLIKSEINDKRFIISPPLFLIPKNSNSTITIVPKKTINESSDKLIDLTITSIPKSNSSYNQNSVSLAVRTHFKIIYRHKKIQENDYNRIKIFNLNNDFYLINKSNFIFTISVSKDRKYNNERVINIKPEEKIKLNNICKINECFVWVSFYDENNDVIKILSLSYDKNQELA